MPIYYDDYVNVLFLYWVEDPTTYEYDDLFHILGIRQLLMIHVYACLGWAWTLNQMIDEMFCV